LYKEKSEILENSKPTVFRDFLFTNLKYPKKGKEKLIIRKRVKTD